MNGKAKKLIYLEKILRWMAIAILKKYNPRIIGITGSVGKTSAKEAIFSVLASEFRVRKNEKNYNNEIGIPLTVIGASSGEKSILKWIVVFLKWLLVIILPLEYPEVLILEIGIDRPGDIKYFTSFIGCEIVVITDISESHLEYFGNSEKLAKEKWSLTENLKDGATAIVNIDNPKIKKLLENSKNGKINFLTFGFSQDADIKAAEVFYNYSQEDSPNEPENIRGLSFKLNFKGTTLPIRLNNILAEHSIYAALAGISAGTVLGINLVEIAAMLENFSMPCGRMNLVNGIKGTFIIDDTYNASPVSVVAALEVLKNIRSERKIAVLGDMLELGKSSEEGHKKATDNFFQIKGDILFAVGKRMKSAVEKLQGHNVDPKRILVFENPMEAGRELQRLMRKGDLILIKGSQGMRMEKVVEEVMAEPGNASEFLCRQDESWKKRPWEDV